MTKFLVLDEDGDPVALEDSASEARAVAADMFGGHFVDGSNGLEVPFEARDNPTTRSGSRLSGRLSPGDDEGPSVILSPEDLEAKDTTGAKALRRTMLPQVSLEELEDLTQGFTDWSEARERLAAPLMQTGLGKKLAADTKEPSIKTSLLATNYKMSKGKKNAVTCPSCKVAMDVHSVDTALGVMDAATCPKCRVTSRIGDVRGLVLTPYYYGFKIIDVLMGMYGPDSEPGEFFGSERKNRVGLKQVIYPLNKSAAEGGGFYERYNAKADLKNWDPVNWSPAATFCSGSSAACRSTCLVLTGQQLTNFAAKLAYTKALMEQPAAFCAMLYLACRQFFYGKSKNPVSRFVRLNVLSDIPWEMVFPSLFDLIPDGRWYDYTKVSPLGRDQPQNYDWTFSFSGTNWAECERVLQAGYRVAMVFAPMDPSKGHTKKTRLADLPATFMGWPVIDGDGDDMRPLDPGGVIVGLRYKKPKKIVESVEKHARFKSGFIVPVAEADGRLIAAHTPQQSEADDFLSDDDLIHQAAMSLYPEYGIGEDD